MPTGVPRQPRVTSQIAREDLLWGLLADASSESVRILRRGHVDLGRLWADLRRWHQSA